MRTGTCRRYGSRRLRPSADTPVVLPPSTVPRSLGPNAREVKQIRQLRIASRYLARFSSDCEGGTAAGPSVSVSRHSLTGEALVPMPVGWMFLDLLLPITYPAEAYGVGSLRSEWSDLVIQHTRLSSVHFHAREACTKRLQSARLIRSLGANARG